MFHMKIWNFQSPGPTDPHFSLFFTSQEEARVYVKSIYKFIDKTKSFRKNYTIAELYKQNQDGSTYLVEEYVGRGMVDSENKIQVWTRDKYDMQIGDCIWRIKEIFSVD
jgi:hypothetical protein